MKVICGPGNLKGVLNRPKVVAVGVFDGVHRGHQLILGRVVREARRKHLTSCVVTFAVHPSHAFAFGPKIPSLTSLEHKLSLIAGAGIDLCLVVHFNKSFASIPAERFVREFLVRKLKTASLYVGEDFVFGRGAQGGIAQLRESSQKFSFRLHVLRHLKIRNRIVSSTRIRRLIKAGRLAQAQEFLGRRVSFLGEVVRGENRGRSLGFPTANLRSRAEVLVPDGIYATRTFLEGRLWKSVAYIGVKPTFRKKTGGRFLEVFLLDFRKNIYGRRMEVFFVKKLRNDRKFQSPDSLIAQMKKDVRAAQKILR